MPQININMILDFFDEMGKRNFPIYNERSLQFELGKFLQVKFGNNYKVEYERNVERLPVNTNGVPVNSLKENTDIFIYSDKYPERFAIELKYPRNKAADKRLHDFAKDIKFMEDVRYRLGVDTYCLTIASDSVFYEKKSPVKSINQTVYDFFRTKDPNGPVVYDKPSVPNMSSGPCTLEITSRNIPVQLKHTYDIVWNRAHDRTTNADIFQCDGYEAPGKLPVYFYFVEILKGGSSSVIGKNLNE